MAVYAVFPRVLKTVAILALTLPVAASGVAQGPPAPVFNVRDYGASGRKADNVRMAIQRAVDACATAGGGTVYFPPGDYSSGTIHLRSRVRLYIEAGATLFSIKDKSAFDQDALIFADGAEQVAIEGRGTIDGQAEYEWRQDDHEDDFIRANKEQMIALGKPIIRSFPRQNQYGKLVLLLRCKDVRISGVSLVDSPSWTIHPYACERMVVDGVYIRSSLKEAVWADGIDPDGCRDLRIANSTIETGDDAICFYSMNWFGPALPCENITVTNCRLTSASSAVKFSDGNMNAIRNVTISNCVITGANRGIAFMNFDGGVVSDVVVSNVVIDTVRHAYFWWGDGDPLHFNIKRRSEVHKSVKPGTDAQAGAIRRVLISHVVARGQGSSVINGHPDSWLEDITVDNLQLHLTADPKAPYDKAVHALEFKQVRNLKLHDVDVTWGEPASPRWESALHVQEATGLTIDGFTGRQAGTSDHAAVVLDDVQDATVRNCRAAAGTQTFLKVSGRGSKGIALGGNDLARAHVPVVTGADVPKGAVRTR
jgi:hypothetical protein